MKAELVFKDYYQEKMKSRIRSAIIVVACIVLATLVCLVSSCMTPIPAGV